MQFVIALYKAYIKKDVSETDTSFFISNFSSVKALCIQRLFPYTCGKMPYSTFFQWLAASTDPFIRMQTISTKQKARHAFAQRAENLRFR